MNQSVTTKFIKDEIEHCMGNRMYGELKIIFVDGRIKRWIRSTSINAPVSSGLYTKNPGEKTTNETASQGVKLEESTNA